MILTARCDGCRHKFPFVQLTEGALRFCPACALERGPNPWPDDPASQEETSIMSPAEVYALVRPGGDATHEEVTADVAELVRAAKNNGPRPRHEPVVRGGAAFWIFAAALVIAFGSVVVFDRCARQPHRVEAPVR